MVFLVVVAHPDDEVLGLGATIYKLTQEGHTVNVCFTGDVNARSYCTSTEKVHKEVHQAMELLGVERVFLGNFPNIQFNTVPHLELVQFIEKAIMETGAQVVFTHHPADLNNDHLHTSIACQAAVRLFQRRKDIPPLKELLFLEVPSATEWALNKGMNQFSPNTYIEVGEEGINKKIEVLQLYHGVMRDYPHPRSIEALKGLAAYRGGQAGMVYAEAFESVFRRGF